MNPWLVVPVLAVIALVYVLLPVGIAMAAWHRRQKLVRCPEIPGHAAVLVAPEPASRRWPACPPCVACAAARCGRSGRGARRRAGALRRPSSIRSAWSDGAPSGSAAVGRRRYITPKRGQSTRNPVQSMRIAPSMSRMSSSAFSPAAHRHTMCRSRPGPSWPPPGSCVLGSHDDDHAGRRPPRGARGTPRDGRG